MDVEKTVVLISVLCTHLMSSALGQLSDIDLEEKDTEASENNLKPCISEEMKA